MTPTDAHPATSGGSRTGADNGSRPGVGSSTGTGTGRRPVTSRSGRGSAPSRPAGRRSYSLHSRRLLGYAGTYLVLALAALITLAPFLVSVLTAFTSTRQFAQQGRSEERRVGKECRTRGSP